MRSTRFFCIIIISIFLSVYSQNNGTQSTSITGNTINELYYNSKTSFLYVLTSSGLSYTNPIDTTTSIPWNNFNLSALPGVRPIGVAASDSSIFVSGYSVINDEINGGKLFTKNFNSPTFRSYDPAFKPDDDEFYRTPAAIAVGDSFVYVSLNRGAIIRNKKNPTSDSDWKLFPIVSSATNQKEFDLNTKLAVQLSNYSDTLKLLTGDSISVLRLESHFKSDTLFKNNHTHSITLNTARDSVTLKWQRYFFTVDTFNTKVDTLVSSVMKFDSISRRISDSIIPLSLAALIRRNDSLKARISTLNNEIKFNEYPPESYGKNAHVQIYDLRWHNGILFSGWTGGLTLSTDNCNTQIGGLFNTANSVLFRNSTVQIPSRILIDNKHGSDKFRVFVKTTSDTVAMSAWVPDASLDTITRFPKHLDSLKKWSYVTDGSIADMTIFGDTLIIGYGKDSQNGIRKFFLFDTLKGSTPIKEWRYKTVPLTGFLEPQLGTNMIIAIPIDSVKYDLWAGTDEGLYHLKYGSTVWRHIEYKKTLASKEEAYAFPTVIYPGYKSSRFAYSLAKSAKVTIEVFDFSMRKVKTVVQNAARNAGERSDLSTEDRWDGRDDKGRAVSPGIYYFKVSSDDGNKFGKVIVYGAKDAGMDP
ncbi:MAG: hypothetical protein JNL74_00025 [Fibrobacteres bacterium]|nr:hypothetical protein [Fibrobacterota bacterium]